MCVGGGGGVGKASSNPRQRAGVRIFKGKVCGIRNGRLEPPCRMTCTDTQEDMKIRHSLR